MNDFSEWLEKEMNRRGIGVRELARMADISPAGISKVINQYRDPGPDLCRAIARALKLPEEEIFIRAGLLESPLSQMFVDLTTEQREIILAEMRKMVEENERAATKAAPHPATTRI